MHYSKIYIYKLCCKDPSITDIYVGYTPRMSSTKSLHKYRCTIPKNNFYNLYVYKFIRENGGWDNWDMIDIMVLNGGNKTIINNEVKKYIHILDATLNDRRYLK